ncbi:OmpA family protein [Chelativorans sp. Marseille-P2723]|uniref:OmpA family protein n=1 Tax=Chelativorans sp. Marseille-P2723 TaxID=2709133 RepID=UPI0015714FC9|nr:OmpA family protein [Chelativorans sp. Marseille-P2723]
MIEVLPLGQYFAALNFTPLRRFSFAAAALAVLLSTGAFADVPGSADHPLVPRYEGAQIVRYESDAYTEYDLRTGKAKDGGVSVVEGKLARITYQGPAERSVLEVFRNYEAALGKAGFQVLFSCAREECGDIPNDIESGPRYMLLWGAGDHHFLSGKLSGPQGNVYVSVYITRNNSGGPARDRAMVQLDIVEARPMESRMVFVEASAMQQDLATGGRVVLYGIQFDFDKDTLRPESEVQIAEIAKLLNDDPALSVLVVGHTDMSGGFDYNMDLSKRRASRVTEALARDHGIAGARLTSVGVGPAAPVASNESEDGRALNRRVEIVKR